MKISKKPVWALALCGSLFASHAMAQSAWTDKPVRLVVPASAGGSLDQLGRALANQMGQLSGQTFIIENRGGGSGVIPRTAVSQAAPDGTMFLLGSVHELTRAALMGKIEYPLDEGNFKSVAMIGSAPNVVVVNAASGIRSIAELQAAARAKPKGLSYGIGSVGNLQHLAGVTFKHATGSELVSIPYKGSAPAIQDLLGGQIDLLFETVPAASAFIRDGRLRALAVTSGSRSPILPDVPTLREAKLDIAPMGTWYGVFAPAALPDGMADKVTRLVNQALGTPELQKRWEEWGMEKEAPMSRQQFAAFVRDESRRWEKLVKDAGVKVD